VPWRYWGKHTILAINQNTDLNLPEVEVMLLVETDGYTKEETDFQMSIVLDVFKRITVGRLNRQLPRKRRRTSGRLEKQHMLCLQES